MERRKFLQNGMLAGASALAFNPLSGKSLKREPAFSLKKQGDLFHLNNAPHDGMFRNMGGKNILDQIRFMHDQGFRALEDNGLMGRTPQTQRSEERRVVKECRLTFGRVHRTI